MPELSAPKPRRSSKRLATRQSTASNGDVHANVSALNRTEMIAEAAYYRAVSRNFEPGHELEDWLAAELEVDQLLMSRGGVHTSA